MHMPPIYLTSHIHIYTNTAPHEHTPFTLHTYAIHIPHTLYNILYTLTQQIRSHHTYSHITHRPYIHTYTTHSICTSHTYPHTIHLFSTETFLCLSLLPSPLLSSFQVLGGNHSHQEVSSPWAVVMSWEECILGHDSISPLWSSAPGPPLSLTAFQWCLEMLLHKSFVRSPAGMGNRMSETEMQWESRKCFPFFLIPWAERQGLSDMSIQMSQVLQSEF